ncbi:hypothetical protein [Estrella lausannensis]|uniref:Uncharacterized protein n=1 Tax=Estrella lausannensis TaxID=483423 RepID=A0A0H5DQD9_9BACT|nr:hypothetical protein [Estrella lausannensis]CRX38732.1 conserved hypothetical protein [Estrella lausannensis]
MAIDLQTALNNATNFIEIASIVRNSKEDISFFGGRYIYAEGYEGSVEIDAIAERFMTLQKTHFEPDEEERKIGRKTIPLISKLYDSNYSRDTNFLTKIFCVFRDFLRNIYIFFSGQGYGTRGSWGINDGGMDFFNSYTSSQYQELFGEKPEGRLFKIVRPGCPDRWSATGVKVL